MLANRIMMSKRGLDVYTKALLHFDETLTKDEVDKVWYSTGFTLSSAQYKFGGKSAYNNASTAYIYTPAINDINLSTGDFTIDFWYRPEAVGDGTSWIYGTTNSSIYISVTGRAFSVSIYYNPGSNFILWDSSTLSANTWYHVAVVRNGNVFTLYVNGVNRGSKTQAITVNDPGANVIIGASASWGSGPINGWLDEFRISKGIARWTTNFTPPTSPY